MYQLQNKESESLSEDFRKFNCIPFEIDFKQYLIDYNA